MKWLIIIVVALLLLGPLRRRLLFPFLSAWRTVVPVIGSGVVGFVLAAMFVNAGAPAWMMVFGPIIAIFMIGTAGKRWFDQNFPPKEK